MKCLLPAGLLALGAAFSQTVTITAPAANTIATPGQTVPVTVTLNPSTDFAAVALFGTSPLGMIDAQTAADSVSFSLALPATLQPASYTITAIGYATSGALVLSAPLKMLVQTTAMPASLNVNPAQLFFKSLGIQLPVMAGGTMADGSVVNLTESPQTSWTSSNTAVAVVTGDGVVSPVGNGTAKVSATLGSLSATAAVTVTLPATPCTYSLGSSSANEGSGGGAVTVNVTTNATNCEWGAASGAPWVVVTAGATGFGNGQVAMMIAANPGAARTANASIAGQSFSIAQDAGGGVAPAIVASGVANGASFVSGGLVAGEIATIFGTNLTTTTGINLASALPLENQLLNVQVLVNGTAAPIFAVDNVNGQQQINFQVPYEIAGQNSVSVQVVDNGVPGNSISVPVLAAEPGIFTYTDGAITYGAILHANYQLADTASPATAGETVLIYCTGLGAVTDAQTDGVAAGGAVQTTLMPTVTIGGMPATVAYAGLAPGYVGLYQINAVVPSGLAAGNQAVLITVNGVGSSSAMLPVE